MSLKKNIDAIHGLILLEDRRNHAEMAFGEADRDIQEHLDSMENIDIRTIFKDLRKALQEGKIKNVLMQLRDEELEDMPAGGVSGMEPLWKLMTDFGVMENGPFEADEVGEYITILTHILATHNEEMQSQAKETYIVGG